MKKLVHTKVVKKSVTAGLAFLFGLSASVLAAPGQLSNAPLYVGSGVQPNILYVVDDSTSMVYEVLKRPSAERVYPQGRYTVVEREEYRCRVGNRWETCTRNVNTQITAYSKDGRYDVSVNPQTKEQLLESCYGYSATAYDPSTAYIPWTGADSNGNAFADQTNIAAARVNPYLSSSGTTDLRTAKYMPWNDADGDGEFDAGECNEGVNDAPNADVTTNPNMVNVSSLTSAQQTNYANWYTYYRKRAYVLKAALSNILYNAEERVGLATINRDIDAGIEVADMMDATNKDAIMEKLFAVKDQQGGLRLTPLKRALVNAGLYFEVGRSPEAGFVGNAGTVNSPIESAANGGSCQQNYTVLMTDGFYHYDLDSGQSGASSLSAVLGQNINADGDNNTDFDGPPYADSRNNTLADIAMHFYERDLATGIPNSVNANNPRDTNEAQHMVTYGVAFGLEGNLPLDVDPARWGTGSIPNYTWPANITENTPESLDDLFHATYNGRGAFYSAGNPQQLIADLQSVQADIVANAAGSAAAAGFNSTNITADTLLFQGWFDTATWVGELRAFSYDGSGIGSPVWEANSILGDRDFATDPRQVITFNGTVGVPFVAPPSYTALGATTINQLQVDDLLLNTPYTAAQTADNQTFLQSMVAYLRGDVTVDGTAVGGFTFRDRDGHILGDIVHSSPQYVAVPKSPYPNYMEGSNHPYFAFVNEHADDPNTSTYDGRDPIVYVGANDGMLHAFYAPPLTGAGNAPAGSGREIFSYIPSFLFSNQNGRGLHELAEEVYSHIPFVDATPTIGDVFVNGDWRTYLVGGVGAGGKGIYVLDITDPAILEEAEIPANAASIVVTEFTHANLGYTFARPQIAKLNNGEWAAIFGNGYNNSGSGQASLFILYLDGNEGSNGPAYREISTGVGDLSVPCDQAGNNCNGLSSPSVIDYTNDMKADRVYAGDIHGNMWAFDLTSDDADDWDVAHQASGNPAPLFIACRGIAANCAADDRQPITTKPLVVAHETQVALTTEPNLFVMFGTGQFIAQGDEATTDTQSFYGVWDAGDDHDRLRRADLQAQTFSTSGDTRSLTSHTVDYGVGGGNEHGWYIDLSSGERSTVTPVIAGQFVAFATTIPGSGPCSAGGSGYLMLAKMFSGGQPDFAVFTDINDIVAGLALTNSPGGATLIDNDLILTDSQGNIETNELNLDENRPSRRAAWSLIK